METLKLKLPNEILFIGETLYTDIRLAEESNFKSSLVLSGNTRKASLKNYVMFINFTFKVLYRMYYKYLYYVFFLI